MTSKPANLLRKRPTLFAWLMVALGLFFWFGGDLALRSVLYCHEQRLFGYQHGWEIIFLGVGTCFFPGAAALLIFPGFGSNYLREITLRLVQLVLILLIYVLAGLTYVIHLARIDSV